MTKHTPGPWEVHEGFDYIRVLPKGARTDDYIVDIDFYNGAGEANARLIAAAPELLSALKNAHLHMQNAWKANCAPDNYAIMEALVVIAKAEGMPRA